jgi:hypothetical protein
VKIIRNFLIKMSSGATATKNQPEETIEQYVIRMKNENR